MKRVCYYVMGHPLLSSNVGGAEIQLHLIGKELQKSGWEPHYIVEREGKVAPTQIEGQSIHSVGNPRRSKMDMLALSPYLLANSFLTYNRPDFDRALDDAQPAILHQRGSSIATGYFASWAERNKKPFVFTIASIGDCTLSGQLWSGIFRQTVKKRLYLYGLSKANVIIATAEYLALEMQKLTPNADIRIIRSGHPVPEGKSVKKKDKILLVGGAMGRQFPSEFVELAKKLPQYEFEIIGGAGKIGNFEQLVSDAKSIPNLKVTGFLPLEEVNRHISEAKILVDASSFAGFHNTFIQAWMRGAAVVSLNIDPDGLMKKNEMGLVSGNPENLLRDVAGLMDNEKERKKLADNALRYALANHDIRKTGEEHRKLYEELTRR